MKYLILMITIFTIFSCETPTKAIEKFEVKYNGALKNMMHKGDISAKVDLVDFKTTTHLYGLGALENLKGEIQIFDSKVINTSVIDSNLVFDNSYDKKATLWVYAVVPKWRTIEVPDSVTTYEVFEKFVEEAAQKNHINTEVPFPFLLEGTAKSFDWHVINWKEGDTEHSHEKHINSGLHGTINNRKVEMLGFYSNAHHAIFTHHTTNMHIHVKTGDGKIAGHVDALTLGQKMVLKLPRIVELEN